MDSSLKKILEKIAVTVRGLSIDMIEGANSGHPGLPLGCAELGAFLFGAHLRLCPNNPRWINRDRLILSAGHGSAWLYSLLHLAGFDLSIQELARFRQLHSKTPGHPELGLTDGVEATTGPLGQGIANAVGQAIGLKMVAARFHSEAFAILSNKVFCLAGDGCLMEGISSEASSLAGHWNLNNLILIHDANKITLDGNLPDEYSEATAMRYRAYGWDVLEMDGYDFDAMETTFSQLRREQKKPTLVIMHTIIGRGAAHKFGTHKVHGSPLGTEEASATKRILGIPETPFYVPQSIYEFFAQKNQKMAFEEQQWQQLFKTWAQDNPEKAQEWAKMEQKKLPENIEQALRSLPLKGPLSTRKASNQVLNHLASCLPQLLGGSADLSSSDLTWIAQSGMIDKENFTGKNIKYGVREFAMAAIAAGIAAGSMFLPFIGTFLVFSDYMRNAIRVACLSELQIIYVFTHDSVLLGEDGPTHQPVEHLASLRAIPQMQVIRPADGHETAMAWYAALLHQNGPTALILSRQNLPLLEECNKPFASGMGKGAYIIKKEKQQPEFSLIATGSELSLALEVAKELEKIGRDTRVISMPSWEIFSQQELPYQKSILGQGAGTLVSIEAASSMGWHRWVGKEGLVISIDSFGASAAKSDLAPHFGFTVDAILARLLAHDLEKQL